ncbi:transglycosylase domain-containing protein [Geobacter sp. SVR]|uniref:transglycosylase domain-containing protein n=1 Tax=Geobacter sp. SVR TaxID=2495594 RepID=UPI00143F0220|nr:biosynthetic peptidoglycan transglycosylase [Geobacter sp. SVR]BCS52078.1 transglycosylase [Geobacter sp. SVR]GCF86533.1 transglycosylase [Geobacter sp. SVR]
MKRFIIALICLIVGYAAYVGVSLWLMPPLSGLANRKYTTTIQVKDWHGQYLPFVVGPTNRYWTSSGRIPAEMKWAVILAEDSNFYKHEGFDVKAIKEAIKYDLEKKSFKRGASTITQQTAKNLFLSREKTITRKVKEIYLAWRMEQELTKGRIIELYLNVAELGPLVYGIGHGAQYYFGKPAAALTPRECAFLAAMLPGPRLAYNPYKNLDRVLKRSDMILRLLRQKGVLSESEYQTALAQSPNIGRLQRKVDESIQKEAIFTATSSAQKPLEPSPAPDRQPATETEKIPGNGEPPAGNEAAPAAGPHEAAPEKQ